MTDTPQTTTPADDRSAAEIERDAAIERISNGDFEELPMTKTPETRPADHSVDVNKMVDRFNKWNPSLCDTRGHRFSPLDRMRCVRCGHLDEPARSVGRGRPVNWTADLDSYLVECRLQGRSLLETSEILGLSPLTCSARELTLRHHPELTARATARIEERKASGDTWLTEIAAQKILERANAR